MLNGAATHSNSRKVAHLTDSFPAGMQINSMEQAGENPDFEPLAGRRRRAITPRLDMVWQRVELYDTPDLRRNTTPVPDL